MDRLHEVFIYKKDIKYPSHKFSYNPPAGYLEYLWPDDDFDEENEVYHAIRETLKGFGLDKSNFGKPTWNPLGDIIGLGNTVLIKPNWVSHKNNSPGSGIDCLVTHTSVLRAVIDYCIIALKGTGRIILGDAPIQAADLNVLFKENHVNDLLNFYKNKGVHIEVRDFRLYQTSGAYGVWHKHRFINTTKDIIEVDLGDISEFNNLENQKRKYHVMDHKADATEEFHANHKHIYSVNRHVLESDVIINLPKPKCHKLAGMTGASKNFVGIISDKACLPHESLGSKADGGDSFPRRNLFKTATARNREFKVQMESRGHFLPALVARYIDVGLRLCTKLFPGNKYEFGSWYGNDTVWRTILDLGTIIKYADKNGVIQKSFQRKQFHLADMIISGENDGPLAPTPKSLGIIIAGYNSSLVDSVITRIMGFDETRIPSVFNFLKNEKLQNDYKSVKIGSNDPRFSLKCIDELEFPGEMNFKPHSGWKGFIELHKQQNG